MVLKTTKMHSLQVCRPGVQNQGLGRAVLSPEALEEAPSCLIQPLAAPDAPWPVDASRQSAFPPRGLPACLCLQAPLFLSLVRTLVVGFGAHPKSKMISS